MKQRRRRTIVREVFPLNLKSFPASQNTREAVREKIKELLRLSEPHSLALSRLVKFLGGIPRNCGAIGRRAIFMEL